MLYTRAGVRGWQVLDKSPTTLPNFWCQSGSLEVFLEYVPRLIKKLVANSVTFNSPPPFCLPASSLKQMWCQPSFVRRSRRRHWQRQSFQIQDWELSSILPCKTIEKVAPKEATKEGTKKRQLWQEGYIGSVRLFKSKIENRHQSWQGCLRKRVWGCQVSWYHCCCHLECLTNGHAKLLKKKLQKRQQWKQSGAFCFLSWAAVGVGGEAPAMQL